MKRFFALLLVLVLAFSLFACDKEEPKDNNQDPAPENQLYIDEVKAAYKKLNNENNFDVTLSLTPTITMDVMSMKIPITFTCKSRLNGEKPEEITTTEQLLALDWVFGGTFFIDSTVFMGMGFSFPYYYEDGILYIQNNESKLKMDMAKIFNEENAEKSNKDILKLFNIILKGVEAPSKDNITCVKTEADGTATYAYTMKGTDVYSYIKTALKVIFQNIDTAEAEGVFEDLLPEISNFEEEEEVEEQEYDWDHMNWEEYLKNEQGMTLAQAREFYISLYGVGSDFTDEQWNEAFLEEFKPEENPSEENLFGDIETAMDLYEMIFGENAKITLTFEDITFSVVSKDGALSSASIKLSSSAIDQSEEEPLTYALDLEVKFNVNATGDAVIITAPEDLDEYVSIDHFFDIFNSDDINLEL